MFARVHKKHMKYQFKIYCDGHCSMHIFVALVLGQMSYLQMYLLCSHCIFPCRIYAKMHWNLIWLDGSEICVIGGIHLMFICEHFYIFNVCIVVSCMRFTIKNHSVCDFYIIQYWRLSVRWLFMGLWLVSDNGNTHDPLSISVRFMPTESEDCEGLSLFGIIDAWNTNLYCTNTQPEIWLDI